MLYMQSGYFLSDERESHVRDSQLTTSGVYLRTWWEYVSKKLVKIGCLPYMACYSPYTVVIRRPGEEMAAGGQISGDEEHSLVLLQPETRVCRQHNSRGAA